MRYHIYSQDVCIGDVDNANSEDHALALYAMRTGMDNIQGLTPVQITKKVTMYLEGTNIPVTFNAPMDFEPSQY